MRDFLFTLAVATGVSASARVQIRGVSYVPVPHAGYMREDCVHRVPSGTAATLANGVFSIHTDSGAVALPACIGSAEAPIVLPAAPLAAALRGGAARSLQLPANYDGWTSYAAFNDSWGFDSMTGYMSVPTVPAAKPDVLYLFPGLQDIDWIPVVDPEPGASDFDILQPVLEYPNQRTGSGWSVRSWWVTLHHGAMSSAEIALTPGASVFGNMTQQNAAGDWFVGSTSGGRTTSLVARAATVGARLQHQRWAYVTTECYGCVGCSTYPTEEVFSQLQLTVNGTAVAAPAWVANPKPNKKPLCHEATHIVNASNIYMTYQA